jgi:hypothetical protein
MFVILQTYYKTVFPDVLRKLRRARVGVHLYGKSSDLCSGNFGEPNGRASRQGKVGKARQGKGGKARYGRLYSLRCEHDSFAIFVCNFT